MKKEQKVLGIDIGGTNIVFGFVNKSGKISNKTSLITADYDAFEPLAKDIFTLVNQQLLKNSSTGIISIGVGAPNGNFYSGNIEFAPNLPWGDKVPVREILNNLFQIPVLITNDANAAAYGEKVFGAAKHMKDFGLITLGTGLGSGIFTNGNLLHGHNGFGGEFGHIIVVENGRFCGCGKHGCLETYVSATGIKITALELLATSHEKSTLSEVKNLTGKVIEQHAVKGDALANKAFDITSQYLGKALANYVTIFDPEAIFLFGGLSLAGDLIFEPTKKYMEGNLMTIFKNKVKLLPSALEQNNAAIVGAAALAWDLL